MTSINKPRCPKCKSKNTTYRVDGSYHCRSCGHDTRKKRRP